MPSPASTTFVRALPVPAAPDQGDQGHDAALAVVVGAHHEQHVGDGDDDRHRPEDQRRDPEDGLPRRGDRVRVARVEDRLDRVERARAEVSEHHAQGADQQRCTRWGARRAGVRAEGHATEPTSGALQENLQQIPASIRAPPYLTERMFPQLRQRIGPALDLIVEFSTLGEYRLDADGVLRPASAFAHAPERVPQLGGAGESLAGRAAVRRIVAGGAAGLAPAVTPAARRLGRDIAVAEAAARPARARLSRRAAPRPRRARRPAAEAAPARGGRGRAALPGGLAPACAGAAGLGRRPGHPSRRPALVRAPPLAARPSPALACPGAAARPCGPILCGISPGFRQAHTRPTRGLDPAVGRWTGLPSSPRPRPAPTSSPSRARITRTWSSGAIATKWARSSSMPGRSSTSTRWRSS